MSSKVESDVARALNMLVDANLSSARSGEDLRQLVEDYFCVGNDQATDDVVCSEFGVKVYHNKQTS
jgi:hypothetical protein